MSNSDGLENWWVQISRNFSIFHSEKHFLWRRSRKNVEIANLQIWFFWQERSCVLSIAASNYPSTNQLLSLCFVWNPFSVIRSGVESGEICLILWSCWKFAINLRKIKAIQWFKNVICLLILWTMAVRTYGDKPLSFQLEENGEYYCIGSEVMLLTYVFNFFKWIFRIYGLCNINFRWETICVCSVDRCTNDTLACIVEPLQMKRERSSSTWVGCCAGILILLYLVIIDAFLCRNQPSLYGLECVSAACHRNRRDHRG